MKLQLPIQLTPKQKEIDASPARFKIIKGGRRGGKSKYGAFWSCRNTLVNPGMHWYLAKSLSLIREEIWPTVMSMMPQDRIVRADTRLFYITVIGNGGKESTLAFKSAEHPDNLRGRGLKSLAIDEASFVYQHLFNVILRPMLADHMAPALMFSSPKVGWFTNTWKDANEGKLKDWAAFYLTIMDNPHIDKDEIAAIKAATPPDVWEQEYLAMEGAGVGVVLPEFTEDSIVRANAKYPGFRRWKCAVGIDWGHSDDTAAIWAHVTPEGHVLFSAEHCQNNWDVSKHCNAINKKNSYLERTPTTYVLDSSAWRTIGGEKSIGEQFRKNGFHCQKATTAFDTSVDHFKRFLRGDSESWIKVDQSCTKLIAGLREWEHGKHEPDAVAAARYILNYIVTMKWTPLADVKPIYHHAADDYNFSTEHIERKLNVSMFKAPISTSWNFDDGAPNG